MRIGNKVGKFLMSNMNNYNGPWRSFMRIRISLDVNKPLRKELSIGTSGGKNKPLSSMNVIQPFVFFTDSFVTVRDFARSY